MMPRSGFGRGAVMRPAVSYRNRSSLANQNNGPLIAELRSTMGLLTQADRDYQGHRAQAIHHVGNAIRSLEPASVRNFQVNPAAAFGNNANGNNAARKNLMPQAASDGHLQDARQRLNTIANQMANLGGSQHHVRARQHVQRAIQELNVALNIR
jgi:hypothetical protein